jgi:hypothetical protein
VGTGGGSLSMNSFIINGFYDHQGCSLCISFLVVSSILPMFPHHSIPLLIPNRHTGVYLKGEIVGGME